MKEQVTSGRLRDFFAGDQEVQGGILGHVAFGVVKIVQWKDGSTDAVKIEGVDPTNESEHAVEMEIMRILGHLRAEFIRRREEKTQWIGNREIKDKQYTV